MKIWGGKYLIFLRLRRFGKSLWISILHHYYGIEFRERFEELFAKYYIGQHPTPLANHYLVLRLEFSRIDTTTEEGTYQGFLDNIVQGVEGFLVTYEYFDFLISQQLERPPDSLQVQEAIFSMAESNNPQPLFDIVSSTLEALSNRDWIKFDEKHIKMILMSYLFSSQLYFIKSEPEFEQQYVDLLLLRRPPFPAPHQFAFELKYLKKKDAHKLSEVIAAGRQQLQGYLNSEELKTLDHLKSWLAVFVGAELKYLGEV